MTCPSLRPSFVCFATCTSATIGCREHQRPGQPCWLLFGCRLPKTCCCCVGSGYLPEACQLKPDKSSGDSWLGFPQLEISKIKTCQMPVRYSKGRRWRCRLAPCKQRVKRRIRRLLKPGWVQAGTVPKTTPMAPHVVCTAVGIREGDHVVQGVVAGNWLDPLRLKATTWQSGYPKPGASPSHTDTTQPVAYKHEPRPRRSYSSWAPGTQPGLHMPTGE